MRLSLIVNPTAGGGRAKRAVGAALERLRARGAEVDVRESRSSAHLADLARESSSGDYDRVVLCGGDGTLHHAMRGIDLEKTTLALLPFGSGDDFAKTLGIPTKVEAAADVVFDGAVREVDVATANGIRYLGVAGLGFDSEVARFANEHSRFLKGSPLYLYSIFRVLPQFRPIAVELVTEGKREPLEIMFAVAGNTTRYGAGIKVVPTAVVDDGQLDICIVHRCTLRDLLVTLPLAYSGKHVKKSFVELRRGKEFTFDSERKLDVFADGEYVTKTPVTFALLPERLRVMVPGS